MANFMRRCNGKVMDSINDNPDIRRVSGDFHFEILDISYCNTNQHQRKAEDSGELEITILESAAREGNFSCIAVVRKRPMIPLLVRWASWVEYATLA